MLVIARLCTVAVVPPRPSRSRIQSQHLFIPAVITKFVINASNVTCHYSSNSTSSCSLFPGHTLLVYFILVNSFFTVFNIIGRKFTTVYFIIVDSFTGFNNGVGIHIRAAGASQTNGRSL